MKRHNKKSVPNALLREFAKTIECLLNVLPDRARTVSDQLLVDDMEHGDGNYAYVAHAALRGRAALRFYHHWEAQRHAHASQRNQQTQ